jgi:hypothetical protein
LFRVLVALIEVSFIPEMELLSAEIVLFNPIAEAFAVDVSSILLCIFCSSFPIEVTDPSVLVSTSSSILCTGAGLEFWIPVSVRK